MGSRVGGRGRGKPHEPGCSPGGATPPRPSVHTPFQELILATSAAQQNIEAFGKAVGEVARKIQKIPIGDFNVPAPTVAAQQRAERTRVHQFVPAGLMCARCGLLSGHRVHKVPRAAEAPTLTKFQVGDRVQVEWHNTWWNGSVVDEQRNDRGEQVVVDVRMDDDQQEWFPVGLVRPAMKVPKFSSVEEADAWMEQQRRLGY